MKILHTADLHLGKRVNDFSMTEDQRYILDQILDIIDKQGIDVVILAGDIYDKAIPTIEAVKLFNDFLNELNRRELTVLCISGNHDSSDRLNFASDLLENSRIYIASEFELPLKKVSIDDVDFYLLPFVKYTYLNHFLDQDFKNYQEAMEYLLTQTELNENSTNILITHQFVMVNNKNPELSESETRSIGGLDSIDHQVFRDFDYVALGHIHKPQPMGRQNIRYSGSILKYSFSETRTLKSVVVFDSETRAIEKVELHPLRDMQSFEASVDEILSGKTLAEYPADNYYQIILTDEDEIIDAINKVRTVYPNIMQLNFRKRMNEYSNEMNISENDIISHTPLELFQDFFTMQAHSDLNDSQLKILEDIIEEVE